MLKTKRKIRADLEHAAPETKGKGIFGLFANGNTSKERREQEEHLTWQPGDYAYTWLPNGMLGSVTCPDGKTITFKYDALGRRTEKTFNGRVHRYLWDGDVIFHEWEYSEAERPQPIVSANGEMSFDRPEPTNNLVTWVYDPDSYVPTAKLVGGKRYSIVSDYIGRPVQAYDERGTLVWQADYDIYGNLLNLKGDRGFVPFRQLGQYEDGDTGLYYNRFRYYDPSTGGYISQDPIGLEGENPTLYGYVSDTNVTHDIYGLDISYKGDTSPYQTRYDPTYPGRPDPRYSIDTTTFESGKSTANGGLRDNKQFWKKWEKLNPSSISKNNRWRIEHGLSPTIDNVWIKEFPEHGGYKGEILIHHHVNQGKYAVPVPASTHVGSGGVWHCK